MALRSACVGATARSVSCSLLEAKKGCVGERSARGTTKGTSAEKSSCRSMGRGDSTILSLLRRPEGVDEGEPRTKTGS
eukprot:1800204-Heterocapsa_arctica.AAC.1